MAIAATFIPTLRGPAPCVLGRRALLISSLVVGVIVATLVFAASRTSLVTRLFGPPTVAMVEAYGDDEASNATFDHSDFDALLKAHVDGHGWVDYAGVGRGAARLDRYIASLESAPFQKLGRDGRLALLINAYNAFTLRLILDHWDHGKLKSIRDIPSAKRWKHERWKLAGKTISLDQLEHEWIRPKFAEPRIHFALVCAAVGCPPLANEAFTGARLEEQLERRTRYVHSHATWFSYDAAKNHVKLTKLYEWYGGDFAQTAGSVIKYTARYDAELAAALGAGKKVKIDWLDYDWALNDVRKRQPR